MISQTPIREGSQSHPRHYVAGHVGKAALDLEADLLDPVELLPFVILEKRVTVVGVEVVAWHGDYEPPWAGLVPPQAPLTRKQP